MTKLGLRLFLSVTLLTAFAVAGFSQSAFALRVHVPFNFVAGRANLPAGDYMVEQDGNTGVIMLQSPGSKSAAAILSSTGSAPLRGHSPELVFEKRNGVNVLTKIFASDSESRNVPVALATLPVR